MLRGLVAFCALAGVTLFVSASPSFAAGTPDVTILVGDFYFCDPQYEDGVCETYIDPGDTVLWDFSPTGLIEFHTATECGATCDNPTNTPLFDSGVQTNAGTYKFTFNSPGQYLYFCSFHPVTMRGVLYVGVTPTPTPSATPPPPVGGVSLQPALAPLPAQEPDRSGATPAIVGAAAGGALLLLGGCWYAARRVVR